MNCEIIIPLLIGIVSGIFSSVLFWVCLNIWFTPTIETDDKIQHGKRCKYIRIYNKSCFDVFEVICYIEYKYSNGSSYFRTDKTLPYLLSKKGESVVKLTGKSPLEKNKDNISTDDFFAQTTGEIIVTITYQNRFGIKKTTKPVTLCYSNDENV